jgi:hypothetical protein
MWKAILMLNCFQNALSSETGTVVLLDNECLKSYILPSHWPKEAAGVKKEWSKIVMLQIFWANSMGPSLWEKTISSQNIQSKSWDESEVAFSISHEIVPCPGIRAFVFHFQTQRWVWFLCWLVTSPRMIRSRRNSSQSTWFPFKCKVCLLKCRFLGPTPKVII